MKILYNSYDGFPSQSVGGGNKIIYELIKSQLNNKLIQNIEYYSCEYNDSYNKSNINDIEPRKLRTKKEVGRFLYNRLNIARKLFSSFYYLNYRFKKIDREFSNFASKDSWDIIHSHMSISHYYFLNTPNAKKILSIHSKGSIRNDTKDVLAFGRFNSYIINEYTKREIIAFNKSDVVVFPSNYARDLFLKEYGEVLNKNVKTEIIYNGIDLELINQIVPEKSFLNNYTNGKEYDVIVLNVANHIKDKNVHVVLKILKMLKDKKVNPLFINIGEGPLTNELRSYIMSEDLSPNFLFLGKIQNDEVIKLMKVSDYLLMPSEKVIYDISILEALACGLTVIASNIGGNKEIIRHGYNGFLFDLDNLLFVCDAISKGLKLEIEPEFKDQLSYINMAKKFFSLYNSF